MKQIWNRPLFDNIIYNFKTNLLPLGLDIDVENNICLSFGSDSADVDEAMAEVN